MSRSRHRKSLDKLFQPELAPVTHVVIMGDSISDRGTLNKRKLFGFIPMSIITFFAAKTHKNRFTNAYTWDDDFGATLDAELITRQLREDALASINTRNHNDIHRKVLEAEENADLADDIIAHDSIGQEAEDAIQLNNDVLIPYEADPDHIRTYCEGGLTAADWKKEHTNGISQYASRHMLTTLQTKREQLIQDDIDNQVNEEQKRNTLIIEWSGGNDLITVNDRPTVEEADKAVAARIDNIRKLYEQGYRKFVLMELPDLSLTPRFQAKHPVEQDIAHEVSDYFNQQLREKAQELKEQLGNIQLDTFDVNTPLRDVKQNPDKYGFTDTMQPFTQSRYYRNRHKGKPLGSHGYMFWDDIHPTGHMHAILCQRLQDKLELKYQFNRPKMKMDAKSLYERFMLAYQQVRRDDRKGFMGIFYKFRNYRLLDKLADLDNPNALLEVTDSMRLRTILNHAIRGGGERTKRLLQDLGWLDENNKINQSIPALAEAGSLVLDSPQLPGRSHESPFK